MGTMEIETWTRNSFDVEAVRVTEENIRQVAEWCTGTVAKTLTNNPRLYVAVETAQSSHKRREAKVFVNDWLVLANGQYKHYRNNSIRLVYHKKDLNQTQKVREMVEQALLVDIETSNVSYPELVSVFTGKVMEIVEGRDE